MAEVHTSVLITRRWPDTPLAFFAGSEIPDFLDTEKKKKKRKETVRFLALGDGGTGDKNQKELAKSMKLVCEKFQCDFVLLLGDNFYPAGLSPTQDP